MIWIMSMMYQNNGVWYMLCREVVFLNDIKYAQVNTIGPFLPAQWLGLYEFDFKTNNVYLW